MAFDNSISNPWQVSEQVEGVMSKKLMRCPIPPEVRVLSIDVFDTLLLRDNKSEVMRFCEVASKQARLLASRGHILSMEELLYARLLCYKVGYQMAAVNRGERDARLSDIFRLFIKTMQLSGKVTVSELLHMELEYEREKLLPNRQVLTFLHTQRLSRKIVLTSDIYFRKKELAELVASVAGDCFEEIYASCDYSLTKKGGGLFKLLLEKEKCLPGEVLHLGDNYHSDVIKPRSLGLHAWHQPRPKFMLARRVMGQLLSRYRFSEEAI